MKDNPSYPRPHRLPWPVCLAVVIIVCMFASTPWLYIRIKDRVAIEQAERKRPDTIYTRDVSGDGRVRFANKGYSTTVENMGFVAEKFEFGIPTYFPDHSRIPKPIER